MSKLYENKPDIKVLMGQLNVLKLLFVVLMPSLGAVILGIGGWAYSQDSKLTDLKTTVKFQKEAIGKHEEKMDKTAAHVGKMGNNIQANTIHLENIKETVNEIRDFLKQQNKRK
jgi:hypothetical protein